MTRRHFDAEDWIERLAQTLGRLAEEQKSLRYTGGGEFGRRGDAMDLPGRSEKLSKFYSTIFAANSGEDGRQHQTLRLAVEDAWSTLCEHPSLAALRVIGSGREEFLVRFPNVYHSARPIDLVSGVMARAEDLQVDGWRSAGRELHALIQPHGKTDRSGEFGFLGTGHHISLFHGLRFEEAVEIGDNMSILPSGLVDAFLLELAVPSVGPEIAGSDWARTVSLVAKPFNWTPEFIVPVAECRIEPDWGGAFREDAEAFIELLAVTHQSPAVCLLTVHYCIHRTAACLLGRPGFAGEWTWGRSARSIDRLARVQKSDPAAIKEAQHVFGKRDSDRYRDCEPAIARIAEALARSGRFAVDDQVLDVAIGLERIYRTTDRGISAQLQKCAAQLLASGAEERAIVEREVKHFYDVRSAIIHGPKGKGKQRTLGERRAAFQSGFSLAQRSVLKLLRDGKPSDRKEP